MSAWTRAHATAAEVAPAAEWRSTIARAAREASGAAFAAVLTCPPSHWYRVEHDTYPNGYSPLIETVQREFLPRIDAVGEGWRFALDRYGPVYAPLESAIRRELAEELRERVLAPASVHSYVSGFMVDPGGQLLGLLVLGGEGDSAALLETTREPLASLCDRAATTLSCALSLSRACGASVAAPSSTDLSALTPRERQIALLAAEGLSAVNVAARLQIAEGTVVVHLRRVHQKLGVHSRVELVRRMLGV